MSLAVADSKTTVPAALFRDPAGLRGSCRAACSPPRRAPRQRRASTVPISDAESGSWSTSPATTVRSGPLLDGVGPSRSSGARARRARRVDGPAPPTPSASGIVAAHGRRWPTRSSSTPPGTASVPCCTRITASHLLRSNAPRLRRSESSCGDGHRGLSAWRSIAARSTTNALGGLSATATAVATDIVLDVLPTFADVAVRDLIRSDSVDGVRCLAGTAVGTILRSPTTTRPCPPGLAGADRARSMRRRCRRRGDGRAVPLSRSNARCRQLGVACSVLGGDDRTRRQ